MARDNDQLIKLLGEAVKALSEPSAKPRPLMTIRDVCEYLAVDKKTLYVYRYGADFPKPALLGGSDKALRWEFDEVRAWVLGQRVS